MWSLLLTILYKWIWLKLTIILGILSYNRDPGNQGSESKNEGVNQAGGSGYPGYLQFEAEEGVSKRREVTRGREITKWKGASN